MIRTHKKYGRFYKERDQKLTSQRCIVVGYKIREEKDSYDMSGCQIDIDDEAITTSVQKATAENLPMGSANNPWQAEDDIH